MGQKAPLGREIWAQPGDEGVQRHGCPFRKEEEADLRLRLFLLLPVVLLGHPRSKWQDQVCVFAAKGNLSQSPNTSDRHDANDGMGLALT
jgi:hypothetical protein